MVNKVAFVFPGQGSQSIGMLNELAKEYSQVHETFAEASEILNYDVWALVQQGPDELLNQTEHTQPALLAASVAIWRIWQNLHGFTPKFLAGHSLGEYTALVCANSLNFNEAIALVAARGKFMQEAVPKGTGAMAAVIGLSSEKVEELCEKASEAEILSPANYNSIGQIVVAGQVNAVNRLIQLAKESGAKLAKIIPVSVPSHCHLMAPAAKRLTEYLTKINISHPTIPVINNVDVCSYAQPAQIMNALIRQMDHPVRWVDTIRYMVAHGVNIIIECGPGKVLSGLNKRIDDQLTTISINTPESLHQALELKNGLFC